MRRQSPDALHDLTPPRNGRRAGALGLAAAAILWLSACASKPSSGGEWIDPQFANISLRGSTVWVVCEAAELPVKRLCQDVLAAEVTALGATAIVASDATPSGQRPLAESQLPAARAAGARSIFSAAISPDATVVQPGPSVGVGIGGYGGGRVGVGGGVGISLPIGGGRVEQALGATGMLTNVATGRTMWTIRTGTAASSDVNAQVSTLGKAVAAAALKAGFF